MTTDEQMMLTTDFGRLHAPLRPWLIRQHTSSCEDCPRSVVPRYDGFHQIFPVWRSFILILKCLNRSIYINKFSSMYERRFWIFEACANFFFNISYSDKYVYSYIGIVWRVIILSVLKSKFNDVIGLQDFFEQLRVFFSDSSGWGKVSCCRIWREKYDAGERLWLHLSSPSIPCGHFTEKSPKVSKKSIVYLFMTFSYNDYCCFSV